MEEQKSVVVTGTSGFVGNALVSHLKKNTCFEIIPVSRQKKKSIYTVNDYLDSPVGDVLIHLAEDSDCKRVNDAGHDYFLRSESNLKGLLKKEFQSVVYFSSSAVYGEEGDSPFSETDETTASDTYKKAKLNNEKRVLQSNGTVVRPSNIIGPGMAKNNVLSDILSQIPGADQIYIKNHAPIRDFIWIDDLVRAIELIINSNKAGIYNIGSGRGISIEGLANLSASIAGESKRFVKSGIKLSKKSYNVLDINKIKTDFSWEPKTSLEDSIELLLKQKKVLPK